MIEESQLGLKGGVTILGQGTDQIFNHCTQTPYNLNAVRAVAPYPSATPGDFRALIDYTFLDGLSCFVNSTRRLSSCPASGARRSPTASPTVIRY